MPSMVIPSSILDATARTLRTHQPTMFKSLIGVHEKFSMMKQQDAQEFFPYIFLQYCVNTLNTRPELEPTVIFCFGVEEESRCMQCKEVCAIVWTRMMMVIWAWVSDPGFREDGHLSGIWEIVATWHTPSDQHLHFQPSTYTIPYPFLPRPVPAPNTSSGPVLPGFTPASPVRKPPPPNLQYCPFRSHSLPVIVRKHDLLPGRRLLRLIGHVEIPDSNNPSVQSKVAAASDSGPEPSVE
ncbi:hypothetical protein BU17DRAFT_85917 [Hysterangium stoloniferum]|nr:hypothetical protein BU17DRAFT_85917 [Hysterangium stoloniferum]